MTLEAVNRLTADFRAFKYMKTVRGTVTAIAVTAGLLVASGFAFSGYSSLSASHEKLSHSIAQLEGEATRLKYEIYERSSREPMTGKPLVVSLIQQAIEIEGLDWDEEQIKAMAKICWRESRYNPNNQHPVSSAFGLYQFLDSTWQYYGIEKTTDPLLQTIAAVRYIEDRYETPEKALEFHLEAHVVNGKMVHYF